MHQLRTHYLFKFNRSMSTDMEHERMLKQLLAKRDDSNDLDLFQDSFRLPLVHGSASGEANLRYSTLLLEWSCPWKKELGFIRQAVILKSTSCLSLNMAKAGFGKKRMMEINAHQEFEGWSCSSIEGISIIYMINNIIASNQSSKLYDFVRTYLLPETYLAWNMNLHALFVAKFRKN